MSLTLYHHPLSSYCWKPLIALYEAGIPFTPRLIDLGDAQDRDAIGALWPLGKFPVLHDAARGRTVPESSIVIEYLAEHFASAEPLLPADAAARLQVRLWDRVFDQYVQTPMQKIVADRCVPKASATRVAWPMRAPCCGRPTPRWSRSSPRATGS